MGIVFGLYTMLMGMLSVGYVRETDGYPAFASALSTISVLPLSILSRWWPERCGIALVIGALVFFYGVVHYVVCVGKPVLSLLLYFLPVTTVWLAVGVSLVGRRTRSVSRD